MDISWSCFVYSLKQDLKKFFSLIYERNNRFVFLENESGKPVFTKALGKLILAIIVCVDIIVL